MSERNVKTDVKAMAQAVVKLIHATGRCFYLDKIFPWFELPRWKYWMRYSQLPKGSDLLNGVRTDKIEHASCSCCGAYRETKVSSYDGRRYCRSCLIDWDKP